MNWFYKLNESTITDSDLNHQILLFSAFFLYEPLKAVQHEHNKNLPLSRRYFWGIPRKSFYHTTLSFWCSCSLLVRKMHLHLRCLPQQIRRELWPLVQYSHLCYIQNMRHSVPRCDCRIFYESFSSRQNTHVHMVNI